MNIGIITFHCSYNFGSALQAYAMQRAMVTLGYKPVLIDYRSKDYNQYKLMQLANPITMLGKLIKYRSLKQRSIIFQAFWDRHFNMTQKTYDYKHEQELSDIADVFDCYVCGSDQIWNLDCTHGAVGPFFLSFVKEGRKVAYAPSLAKTSFNPDNFDKQLVAQYLESFDFVSVREASTVSMFQDLVDKTIEVAPDPTFALEKDEYERIAVEPRLSEPYIFVYLLRHCPEVLDEARLLAEKHSLRILYCCDRKLNLPNALWVTGAGPSEFLGLIGNATYVVSNSFHASVFSCIFEKDFISYANDSSASRISEYLHRVGLDGRCVDTVYHKELEPIDWNRVRGSLDEMRYKSLEMLKRAIEG